MPDYSQYVSLFCVQRPVPFVVLLVQQFELEQVMEMLVVEVEQTLKMMVYILKDVGLVFLRVEH
jgi:hypothetical protein